MLSKMYRDAMRSIEREAAELPDPWAMMADEVRGVLAEREHVRREARALRELVSVHGAAVAKALDSLGGVAFVGDLGEAVDGLGARSVVNVWRGLVELLDAGLLSVWWALDEDGEPAEVTVGLRYEIELPELPE